MYVIHRNGKPFRTTYSQNAYIKKSHAKKLITEVVEREFKEMLGVELVSDINLDDWKRKAENLSNEFTIVTYIPETEV